jgi:hypothetical protein
VTAADLLEDLARQGFTLAAEGDGIRVRPASRLSEDLRQAVRRYKAELLAILSAQAAPLPPTRPSEPSAPSAAPWDAAVADAVLAAVNARLDRALAKGGEADTPARRNVVEAYRRVIAGYHRDRHPLLWESLAAAEGLLARWRTSG